MKKFVVFLSVIGLALLGCDSGDDGEGTEVAGETGEETGDETPEGGGSMAGVMAGAEAAFGGGTVSTWALLDDDGTVLEVGVNLTAAALDEAAESEHVHVAFPEQVVDQTFFDHFVIDFESGGHPPGPYLVPHFDFHFYGITNETQLAIDCLAEPLPEGNAAGEPAMGNDYMPDMYMIPGTGLETDDPPGTCVPEMGVHAVDLTSGELAPEDPTEFTISYILGYHMGALAFIEPMMSQAYLATRPEISAAVKGPAKLGWSTMWPTQFDASYDDESGVYSLVNSEIIAID